MKVHRAQQRPVEAIKLDATTVAEFEEMAAWCDGFDCSAEGWANPSDWSFWVKTPEGHAWASNLTHWIARDGSGRCRVVWIDAFEEIYDIYPHGAQPEHGLPQEGRDLTGLDWSWNCPPCGAGRSSPGGFIELRTLGTGSKPTVAITTCEVCGYTKVAACDEVASVHLASMGATWTIE